MASNKAVQAKREGTKDRGLARMGCSFISGHLSNPCPRQWLVKHWRRKPIGTSAGKAENPLMCLGPFLHLCLICMDKNPDASSLWIKKYIYKRQTKDFMFHVSPCGLFYYCSLHLSSCRKWSSLSHAVLVPQPRKYLDIPSKGHSCTFRWKVLHWKVTHSHYT